MGAHDIIFSSNVRMAAPGHQERFSPPKLNAGCELTKETFAGLSRNDEDAPGADHPECSFSA